MTFEEVFVAVVVILLLLIFAVGTITIFQIGFQRSNDESYCENINFSYSQHLDNDHFNCCKNEIIIVDNKYVEKEDCVKGKWNTIW